jgi:hypothetical protein
LLPDISVRATGATRDFARRQLRQMTRSGGIVSMWTTRSENALISGGKAAIHVVTTPARPRDIPPRRSRLVLDGAHRSPGLFAAAVAA